MKTHIGMLPQSFVLAGLVIAGAHVASAQDVYKVNYYDQAYETVLSKFATVRIDNPGQTYGNLCAMIYVFTSDQQMEECCGCIISHDGLRTLNIKQNLKSNPLTGSPTPATLGIRQTGVIKVISSTVNGGGSACDPSSGVSPKANLRVWVTHSQGNFFSNVGTNTVQIPIITETESSDSPLSAAELSSLQAQCSFINILGSGHGICTCGFGD